MSASKVVDELPPRAPGRVRVVHFSAPWCARCPAFAEAMQRLHEKIGFEWLHATLPEASELQEVYGICKLPAVAIESDGAPPLVLQPTSEDAVRDALLSRLDLSCDF